MVAKLLIVLVQKKKHLQDDEVGKEAACPESYNSHEKQPPANLSVGFGVTVFPNRQA